jgi:hypothetical protein
MACRKTSRPQRLEVLPRRRPRTRRKVERGSACERAMRLLGATFFHAIASALLSVFLSAAAMRTFVLPRRPQPPGTGLNTSGSLSTSMATCALVRWLRLDRRSLDKNATPALVADAVLKVRLGSINIRIEDDLPKASAQARLATGRIVRQWPGTVASTTASCSRRASALRRCCASCRDRQFGNSREARRAITPFRNSGQARRAGRPAG